MNKEVWVKVTGNDGTTDELSGETITITKNINQVFINNGYSTYEYYLSYLKGIEWINDVTVNSSEQ